MSNRVRANHHAYARYEHVTGYMPRSKLVIGVGAGFPTGQVEQAFNSKAGHRKPNNVSVVGPGPEQPVGLNAARASLSTQYCAVRVGSFNRCNGGFADPPKPVFVPVRRSAPSMLRLRPTRCQEQNKYQRCHACCACHESPANRPTRLARNSGTWIAKMDKRPGGLSH